MKSILQIISPIRLSYGHNPDTAKTGQGCLLDVCSYLNGDAEVTDKTSCVDALIRPFAMMVNDFTTDSKRVELLKFIPRLMVSAQSAEAQRDRRLKVFEQFRLCQEDNTRAVRDIIGLDVATYHYQEYLRTKLNAVASRLPKEDFPWATQAAIQYGLTMKYLNQAEMEISRNDTVQQNLISSTRTRLREQAVTCLGNLLTDEVLVETPTHLGRAQQLVDTRQAVWPV